MSQWLTNAELFPKRRKMIGLADEECGDIVQAHVVLVSSEKSSAKSHQGKNRAV